MAMIIIFIIFFLLRSVAILRNRIITDADTRHWILTDDHGLDELIRRSMTGKYLMCNEIKFLHAKMKHFDHLHYYAHIVGSSFTFSSLAVFFVRQFYTVIVGNIQVFFFV